MRVILRLHRSPEKHGWHDRIERSYMCVSVLTVMGDARVTKVKAERTEYSSRDDARWRDGEERLVGAPGAETRDREKCSGPKSRPPVQQYLRACRGPHPTSRCAGQLLRPARQKLPIVARDCCRPLRAGRSWSPRLHWLPPLAHLSGHTCSRHR